MNMRPTPPDLLLAIAPYLAAAAFVLLWLYTLAILTHYVAAW